ncbi:hypothetical protein CDL15_Pgr011147 [Punica granatum]|uniref:Uncharacterized protein n=1 Tax=Punica granatum TaxID=22663 RepID=A0A218WZ28_PUNGR|nr:hypothetical protein CDL15_Pgr011147 [Punica granatum]PKI77627.1 hypothetical protein CRG98_001965 [Punica granatum]
MTNDMSGRVPGAPRVSRDPPDLSGTPFLTGLPGPDPLTSKRHPKTGLQAPRDHRGHGTSFRRPFETLQDFPRDVSVIANAFRRIFGARPRKTEITAILEHLKTFGKH